MLICPNQSVNKGTFNVSWPHGMFEKCKEFFERHCFHAKLIENKCHTWQSSGGGVEAVLANLRRREAAGILRNVFIPHKTSQGACGYACPPTTTYHVAHPLSPLRNNKTIPQHHETQTHTSLDIHVRIQTDGKRSNTRYAVWRGS